MNFTAIFCCYVLLPYFASLVSPPQEAITCYAVERKNGWLKNAGNIIKNCLVSRQPLSVEQPKDKWIEPEDKCLDMDDKYFVQKLDHYHHNDRNTWKQRYLVNDQYYQGNGIVFLRICTEQNFTVWNMLNGRWSDYCKSTNALCIAIERRGFGFSLPNGNLEDNNLKYINSEQTLADVAWFIYNFRDLQTGQVLPMNLKWVAYGSFEEGALAAWLRMKFPHLVYAVLSLSAPVLAKVEYDGYFKHIEKDMLNVESKFKEEINKAYTSMNMYLRDNHIRNLENLIIFCSHKLLYSEFIAKNVKLFYYLLAHTVATILQYDNDDKKKKATDIMMNTIDMYGNPKSPLEKFAILVNWNVGEKQNKCLQTNYNFVVPGYKIITYGGYPTYYYLLRETFGNRAILYQSCNELGRFQTFKNYFGYSIDLRFFMEFCSDVFEEQFSPENLERSVRRTNIFYGGLSIEVSRVIFVYGSNDPYRDLGLIDRHPEKSVTHILEGAKLCNELDDITSNHDVKQDIYNQLKQWLNLSENN